VDDARSCTGVAMVAVSRVVLASASLAAFALECACGGRAVLEPSADASTTHAATEEGAETGALDASAEADPVRGVDDAGPPVEASIPDFDASAPCSAGNYFIEVTDETGTRILRSGCDDSVPTVSGSCCNEGTGSFSVAACGGGASMLFVWYGGPNSYDYYSENDGAALQWGMGPIHFDNVPSNSGGMRAWVSVGGNYSALFGPQGPHDDASALKPMSGRFCVRW
jgi:hypothetical protein